MPADVQVIIVNFNAGEALTHCVESVLAQDVPVGIAVVDNASSDDSVAGLIQSLGNDPRLTVRARGDNPGFARAVNEALAGLETGVEYLLILNPDCVMRPGSLQTLLAALQEDRRAALAGPGVVDVRGASMRGTLRRFPDPWKSLMTFTGLWRLGRRFPAFRGVEMDAEEPVRTVRAEAVSGACMLLKFGIFHELGGMDGRYGLHCEDLDLMYRLKQQGWHCLFVPQAQVYHQQGLSSSSRPFWVHWQKHRGMQRFFLKFQAQAHVLPVRGLVLAGIWLRFLLTLPLAWRRG